MQSKKTAKKFILNMTVIQFFKFYDKKNICAFLKIIIDKAIKQIYHLIIDRLIKQKNLSFASTSALKLWHRK